MIPLNYTFHGIPVICSFAKNIICRFFEGSFTICLFTFEKKKKQMNKKFIKRHPVYCDASHDMPVEASDYSTSIPWNVVNYLGLLRTLNDFTCDCLACIYQSYLLYTKWSTSKKCYFSTMLQKYYILRKFNNRIDSIMARILAPHPSSNTTASGSLKHRFRWSNSRGSYSQKLWKCIFITLFY